MVFKSFYISELVQNDMTKVNIGQCVDFFHNINCYERVVEGTQSYQPLYMKSYKNYILGTLVQSYDTVLTKFSEKIGVQGEVILPDTKINDKLFFYIDVEANIIYLQNKRYPSKTLNKNLSKLRIEKILHNCIGKAIALIPANINYNVEQLIEIFQNTYVKKIVFKNLNGIELPKGTVIHNPREDLDDAVGESWNFYSKDSVDYMEFRADNDTALNTNPLVKLGLKLAEIGNPNGKKVLNQMEIIDDGMKINVKPEGNNNFILNVTKNDLDDSYKIYEKILKKNIRDYVDRLDE